MLGIIRVQFCTMLFKNYNPKVRPIVEPNQPVGVDIKQELVAVDVMNQTLKTNVELSWLVERL